MSETIPDIIDKLTDASGAEKLETLRARRPVTKTQAQQSYLALFEPTSVADVSLSERFAVATFVALLHGDAVAARHYAGLLAKSEGGPATNTAIATTAKVAAAHGPYGRYPAGPLSAEDEPGAVLPLTLRRLQSSDRGWSQPWNTHICWSSIRAIPVLRPCSG